jgi:hypothetical protein
MISYRDTAQYSNSPHAPAQAPASDAFVKLQIIVREARIGVTVLYA